MNNYFSLIFAILLPIIIVQSACTPASNAQSTQNTSDSSFSINEPQQPKKPVQWSVSLQKITQDSFMILYVGTIDEGWKLYWKSYIEDGPVPLKINPTQNPNLKVGEPKPDHEAKKYFDEMFEGDMEVFTKKVVITQSVNVLDVNQSKAFKGYLEYMCCNDSSCLPPVSVDFDLELK